MTSRDVGGRHQWRSVDRCEKQPFVQVQLIKAEDGGQINSDCARKQIKFLWRFSNTYKSTIRDGGSTALYAVHTVDMVYTVDMIDYAVDMC